MLFILPILAEVTYDYPEGIHPSHFFPCMFLLSCVLLVPYLFFGLLGFSARVSQILTGIFLFIFILFLITFFPGCMTSFEHWI